MKKLDGFRKCKNDKERWEWVIANQDGDITVILDNDDTMVVVEDEDEETCHFADYIGYGGVEVLLDILGVKCEGC